MLITTWYWSKQCERLEAISCLWSSASRTLLETYNCISLLSVPFVNMKQCFFLQAVTLLQNISDYKYYLRILGDFTTWPTSWRVVLLKQQRSHHSTFSVVFLLSVFSLHRWCILLCAMFLDFCTLSWLHALRQRSHKRPCYLYTKDVTKDTLVFSSFTLRQFQ